MKVSTKWLNKYVDVNDIKRKDMAEKIIRTSVEVDKDYRLDEGLKKVVVGEILSIQKHPKSDHLNICQVDVGDDSPYQIVCGAPNVKKGIKVIVALPNSWIGHHTKIKKAKMRGVTSMGMICSLQELGFLENVVPNEYLNGIYILPQDSVVGDSVFKYLGMDEDIISLDITPNRGDLLSMRGVAHEIGAIYKRKVNFPKSELVENNDDKIEDYLTVKFDEKVTPSYLTRVVKNVKIKPSPLWLQIHLWNAGIKPINNVIDVANLVMLDFGQPISVYDYAKINGKNLSVRFAQNQEFIKLSDEEKIKLDKNNLIVTDEKQPISLAGIVDSCEVKVDNQTQDIVLQAAIFDSRFVRKTAKNKNIHTESSMRFERGINPLDIKEALDCCANLISKLAYGNVTKGILGKDLSNKKASNIEITVTKINKVLGTNLTDHEIIDIFTRLGFEVRNFESRLSVLVPKRRPDVTTQADLIEEVARIFGYDNISSTLPKGQSTLGGYTDKQRLIRTTRRILESSGLTQIISYSLTSDKKANRFKLRNAEKTELLLPMTSDRTTVRMNLISNLLDVIAYNVARKTENIAIYEQGRVFLKDKDKIRPQEFEYVAGALTGLFKKSSWNESKKDVDFYLAKGIVNHLLYDLGITKVNYKATDKHLEMHPLRTADIYFDDALIGFVGQIHPKILKEYSLKPTYAFQLNLDEVLKANKTPEIYQPISKYPTIERDIAILVDKDIENSQIISEIMNCGGKYLTKADIFDVYVGKNIESKFKSLAYKLVFNNPNGTLVDKEVNEVLENIIEKLKEKFNAKIR